MIKNNWLMQKNNLKFTVSNEFHLYFRKKLTYRTSIEIWTNNNRLIDRSILFKNWLPFHSIFFVNQFILFNLISCGNFKQKSFRNSHARQSRYLISCGQYIAWYLPHWIIIDPLSAWGSYPVGGSATRR